MHPKTPLQTLFTAAGNDALDLFESMLIYDPLKRISALDALNHYYFRNAPIPTKPEMLPRNTNVPTGAGEKNLKKRKAEAGDYLSEQKPKLARLLFA
ncbi:TFIIH complex serine/threonine-protein kinase subunit kin28 [Podochytrium sp. JEL0797]|nr:TFIIH complex serine/threonine-protein kinase subunit kin28 [Podochytrium sp. JEL0797]